MSKIWSKEEEKEFIELFSNKTNKELSLIFNKSDSQIINKASHLKLTKSKNHRSNIISKVKSQPISENIENELLKLYKDKSINEMANILNKTSSQIRKLMKKLKLKKTIKEVNDVRSRIIKSNSRDITFELVKEVALNYQTRGQFNLMDNATYEAARKNGWLNDVCEHMVNRKFSFPQLILQNILEFILKEKCIYEDRIVLKPYEIDCYFEKYKIGWEYNGRRFHSENRINDKYKINLSLERGIKLFIINEEKKNLHRKYILNIKTQLINQLPEINKITNLSINESDILNYKISSIKINVLTDEEKNFCIGKSIKEINKLSRKIARKIKQYDLFNELKMEKPQLLVRNKTFKNFDEYISYIKENNISSLKDLKSTYNKIMKRFNISTDVLKDYFLSLPK